MVEHHVANVIVAGSTPVTRSIFLPEFRAISGLAGVARSVTYDSTLPRLAPCKTRPCRGLQAKKDLSLVRLCGLSPLSGAAAPEPPIVGLHPTPCRVVQSAELSVWFGSAGRQAALSGVTPHTPAGCRPYQGLRPRPPDSGVAPHTPDGQATLSRQFSGYDYPPVIISFRQNTSGTAAEKQLIASVTIPIADSAELPLISQQF